MRGRVPAFTSTPPFFLHQRPCTVLVRGSALVTARETQLRLLETRFGGAAAPQFGAHTLLQRKSRSAGKRAHLATICVRIYVHSASVRAHA